MPSTYPVESKCGMDMALNRIEAASNHKSRPQDRCGAGKRRIEEAMFAVIKSGGRQYKVSVGQTLEVNRLPVEVGSQLQLKDVLLISDANTTMIGTPLVENAMVLATATRQARGEKLIVFKYKSKKRYRHRRGHRQELTVLTIDDIVADGKSLITGEAPRARDEEVSEEEIETPAEPTEAEAATGEVDEPEAEKRTSRRRRTTHVEDTESNAEEE
jgi:large subunit ribosomal protein L21